MSATRLALLNYLPGMAVLTSGRYTVLHSNGHKKPGSVYLPKGFTFPRCPNCDVAYLASPGPLPQDDSDRYGDDLNREI